MLSSYCKKDTYKQKRDRVGPFFEKMMFKQIQFHDVKVPMSHLNYVRRGWVNLTTFVRDKTSENFDHFL